MARTQEMKPGLFARLKNRISHWSKTKKILMGILLFFIILVVFVVGYCTYVIADAPKIDTDNIKNLLSQSTVIYDDQGEEIGSVYKDENRTNVEYKDIPQDLIDATISIEDKTFWDHHGFNFIRLAGAVYDKVVHGGHIRGTSTISQQLARNIFLKDTRFDYSIKRKIIEAYYTVILEKNLTKKQIITAYLNTVSFGNSLHGVEAASHFYFSKSVQDLSLEQCALLASIIQMPSEYAPVKLVDSSQINDEDIVYGDSTHGVYKLNDASKNRRDYALKEMKTNGYISEDEYKAATQVALADMLSPNITAANAYRSYFIDYVISQVKDDLMDKYNITADEAYQKIYSGGLKIYSTMDSQAQEVIEQGFEDDSNFQRLTDINFDNDGNILDSSGRVLLVKEINHLDDDGNLLLNSSQVKKTDDGLVFLNDTIFNFYHTKVAGATEYSLELKPAYQRIDGRYFTRNGGYINVPGNFKKIDSDDNLVVSSKFLESNPDFIKENEDGTFTISKEYLTLPQLVVQPQAAMAIVENDTGYVKALVGGRETYGEQLFNRGASPRQPGSTIKPLAVYGPALQMSLEEAAAGKKHNFVDYHIDKQGTKYWGDYITAGSIIIDEPTTLNGKRWPRNWDNKFSGIQTLRTALTLSRNTTSLKTFMQVGTDYSASMVKKFGLSQFVSEGDANDMNPGALAVGGMVKGASPLEMADAFTTFANAGVRHDSTPYTKVLDASGNVILDKEDTKTTEVIDAGVAWIMKDILHGVTGTLSNGVYTFGKTGTTENNQDHWVVMGTPRYTTAIWLGSDFNNSLTGYTFSLESFVKSMMAQVDQAGNGYYPPRPSNVINVGGEYFIRGTETGVVSKSSLNKKVVICADSGYLATPGCTNTKEIEYDEFAGDTLNEYYCNIHNPDVSKYPLAPGIALVPKAEEPPKSETPAAEETPAPGSQTPGTP